jgi:putative flippase GtrA
LLQKPLTVKNPLVYFLAVLGGYFIDFSVYATLVKSGLSVYLANAAGFCVGSITNVIFIRKFVFRNSRFDFWTDLQLSMVSNSLIFAVGIFMLWGLVELAAINPYGAKFISNGATFVANYVIRVVCF